MKAVSFVHISDTHIGPTAVYNRFGHVSYPCAERLVEIINNLPVTPDFVIHTGDVVTDPDPDSYRLAADLLAQINVPTYYVVGNHDTAVDIRNYMSMGTHQSLSDNPDLLTYAFDVNGVRFLTIDARAGDEIDPSGMLSDEQLAIVEREVTTGDSPLVVFMHYPALPINAPWMDRKMLILNGEKLHQALLPARDRLRGVFYGHIHQNMQVVRDGISYNSVASAFSQFTAWATDEMFGIDRDHLPGYAFVQLLPEQTIVHQHTFSRPD